MVSALDRKLLRDLGRMRGQVLTISLVVACGIATYALTAGSYASLLAARDDYYARYQFPDMFASLKRAPRSVKTELEAIPGVARVRVRLAQQATLPMPGIEEPIAARVVSAPAGGTPTLGDILLRSGQWPTRDDDVLVLQAFAQAHHLALGDRIPVIINGVQRRLRIVGTAISPEVLFAVAPGQFVPDPLRYAVLWLPEDSLAALLQMEGAFNDVVLDLQRDANERAVLAAVERVLRPHGGMQPYGRKGHPSHSILLGELTQWQTTTRIVPSMFLGVAAFLISVVLGRLVQLQRTQIAVLKAVGYNGVAVGLHYAKLVLVIIALGTAVGIPLGEYVGRAMLSVYEAYFHFPSLTFVFDAAMMARACGISFAAAGLGALWAVREVVALPPAEAMQPQQPTVYRKALSDYLRLSALLGQAARMVLREVERKPLRFLLSVIGIAFSVALLVLGRFSYDSVETYMDISFARAQRQDMTVSFDAPQPLSALRELAHLPGVQRVEGERILSARIRVGHREREITIAGHQHGARLTQLLDSHGTVHKSPEDGLLLTRALAHILRVETGQEVELTAREGERPTRVVPVQGTIEEMYGLSAHVSRQGLARILGETPSVSVAYLRVDRDRRAAVLAALRQRPEVLGVTQREHMIQRFREQTADQMQFTTWFITLFAAVITAGVVYNNARLALSTRSRDLASLRVLGFRRGEISALLLGELFLQVALALWPGMMLGTYLADLMMSAADPEQYRFPLIVSLRTYVFAALVTFGAAAGAALVVRRKLDHLDLIGVLKTRE